MGATVHQKGSAAVKNADIVVSMLESGPVVEDVLFNQGEAEAMKPGALLIDMASIKPREARDHAARLRSMGIVHLDAPVSGGVVGTEDIEHGLVGVDHSGLFVELASRNGME